MFFQDVNAGQVTKIWFDLPAEMKGDVISCLVEHVHCEKREIINALMQRFEFGLLDASRIYNWSKLLNVTCIQFYNLQNTTTKLNIERRNS